MRLRTRIGAAMAAVTLTGIATTGVLTSLRVTRTIHEEADRRLLESTSALGGEWRALANDVSALVAEAAGAQELKTPLSRLALNLVPAESREIIHLAPEIRETTGLDFLQIFSDRGVVLSNGHWQVFYGRPDPSGWEIVERRGTTPAAHWRQVKGERILALETAIRVEMAGKVFHVVGGRAITPAMIHEMGRRTGGALYINMADDARILPPGVAPQDIGHLADARIVEYEGSQFVVGRPPTREAAGISFYPIRQPDGTKLGDFVLRISQARLNALARELIWTFIWLGTASVLLAWIITFWMARRITRPIEELAVAAARVGVGRSPGPMPRVTSDEVGDLVRSFEQMTSDLAESRRELVRAERIGAWREIAQRLAHEIKNALSPIQLSLETVQRSHRLNHPDFDDILAEAVTTVRDEVDGLRRLVNEFSQFARMPELKLEPGPIESLLDHAATLHGRNSRNVEVVLDTPPGLPAVAHDPEALGRAIGNVVLNAVEASPRNGRVRLSASALPDGLVEILVDDQGPGVPKSDREKVFEPYFTTKDGGTGLGLAMAYKVVAEHGGRIEIHDGPGGGRFRIVLPGLSAGDGQQRAEA
jgi:two-component system nitrogen regulation sensor histidine kinase NtrY